MEDIAPDLIASIKNCLHSEWRMTKNLLRSCLLSMEKAKAILMRRTTRIV
jgi:hypothetical protein